MATVADTLKQCDGIIVGSWFKVGHKDEGDVYEDYVKEFVAAAKR